MKVGSGELAHREARQAEAACNDGERQRHVAKEPRHRAVRERGHPAEGVIEVRGGIDQESQAQEGGHRSDEQAGPGLSDAGDIAPVDLRSPRWAEADVRLQRFRRLFLAEPAIVEARADLVDGARCGLSHFSGFEASNSVHERNHPRYGFVGGGHGPLDTMIGQNGQPSVSAY
jgi:hypothetical protein